ncbi:MAG: GNAT family N-acetyltransferase [Deltaproteobacteria bacterium]|nr:GNAT family N-acetyltransferase [Deltaproteobacteria bacterium]
MTPIEPHWFFGCPLLGREAVELLYEAVGHIKKFYSPYFPETIVSGIRPHGETASRLWRFFGSGFDFYLHSAGIQCSASLKDGVDGFLSRRSANHRHKLKKEGVRASDKGIYFERIMPSSPEDAARTYSRMLAVEYASWKGIGKCGITEPPSRQFYDIMLRRLSVTKTARVIFAKREDKDIGFIFGGMAGRIYRGQQFSYDNEWKNFSIGNLMQMEQIHWLCQEGARRYDMGPRMDYKVHWTEKETHMQTWIIRKK